MATGDIKNNLRKLQNELKLVHYTQEVDFEKMLIGLSAPFLPILHYIFTEYSCGLSSYFSSTGYDLYAKSDFRFLEIIYKILVQEFDTKPLLTKQQFFAIGYSEMKVIFTTKIVSLCRQKNGSITAKLGKKKTKNLTGNTKGSNQNKWLESVSNGDNQMKYVPSGDKQSLNYDGDKPVTRKQSMDFVGTVGDYSDIKSRILVSDTEDFSRDTDDTPTEYSKNPPKITAKDIIKSSSFIIKSPQPNPELALTPIKENLFCTPQEVETIEIDSGLLDITDIGEDSFFETGGAIVVSDTEEDVAPNFPEFVITKHSNDVKNIKINTELPIQLPLSHQSLPHHSLPGNVTVTSLQCNPEIRLETNRSKQNTSQHQQCEQCQQCLENCDSIKTLISTITAMKREITNIVNVNNDLSAKVVLMETKIKILDISKGGEKVGDNEEEEEEEESTSNTYKEIVTLRKIPHEEKGTILSNLNDSRRHGSDSSNSKNAGKQYSPIQYTDDDIIIKDFKPIGMKDVQKMLNEVGEDKENDTNVVRQSRPKQVKVRKETLKLKVLTADSESENNTLRGLTSLRDDDESSSSGVLNVSNIFDDDLMKQTVRNVSKKLQETEKMLRKSGNYMVK